MAESLQVGASSTYNKDGHLVEVAFYILDEEKDLLVPSELDGSASAELLYQDHSQALTKFTKDYANDDGAIRVFFLNPHHDSDLFVRVKAVVSGDDHEFTVKVLDESAHGAPLSDVVHPRTDPKPPRTEHDPYSTYERQLEKDTNQEVVQARQVLFKLDPTIEFEPLVEGSEIIYEGGGNRYLPLTDDPTVLARQQEDVYPPEVGMRSFIEGATTNLISNPEFVDEPGDVPAALTLGKPSDVDVTPAIIDLNDTAQQLRLHLRGMGGPYTGPRVVAISAADPISVDPTEPVSFSVLLRTSIRSGPVNTLRLSLNWLDAGGSSLGVSGVADFNPATFELQQMLQADVSVEPSDIPVNASSVEWRIEVGSIDGADAMTLFLALPQLEQTSFPTTRVAGSRTRELLSAPQYDHLLPDQGTVTVAFAPLYDGKPLQDAVFFDSRSTNLTNGYILKHRTDGVIEFSAYDSDGNVASVETDEVILVAGEARSFSASWSPSVRRIFDGDSLMEEDASSYDAPSREDKFSIGSSILGDDHINGELLSFEIQSVSR